MQGKSPPVQVKEPYGNLDMVSCRLSTCSVQSTSADNTFKRDWQYIEKKERLLPLVDSLCHYCPRGGSIDQTLKCHKSIYFVLIHYVTVISGWVFLG